MALAAKMTNKKMTKTMLQSSALLWVLNGRQSKWQRLQHGFEFSHAPFHSLSCWSVAPNNKSWRPPNWVWYSQKANKDIIMSLWGRKFGGVIRHFLTLLRGKTQTLRSQSDNNFAKKAFLEVQTCKKFSPSINDASHLDQDGFLYFF